MDGACSHRDGWLRAGDGELGKQCRVERRKASGPGGQRRNRVRTAVRLVHGPTGLVAKADDFRSQAENMKVALRRLRVRIAVNVRCPVDPGAPALPPEFLAQRSPGGTLDVRRRNPAYPVVVATVLDALSAAGGSFARAGRILGLTTSQVVRFVDSEPHVRAAAHALQGR